MGKKGARVIPPGPLEYYFRGEPLPRTSSKGTVVQLHHWGVRGRGLLFLLLAMSLSAVACQDLGPEDRSGPGAIHVDLVSPYGAEGSAVFEVAGGTGIGAVTSFGGEVYFNHNYGTETTKVVVIMDVPGQIRFKIRTSNVGDLPTVSVLQVADGNDALRPSLGGYEIEIAQVEDEVSP